MTLGRIRFWGGGDSEQDLLFLLDSHPEFQ